METYHVIAVMRSNGGYCKVLVSVSDMKENDYAYADYISPSDTVIEKVGEIQITGDISYLSHSMVCD